MHYPYGYFCLLPYFEKFVAKSENITVGMLLDLWVEEELKPGNLSKGYLRLFSAVLQRAFRFTIFPKRLITFNPMQYVVWRGKKEEYEMCLDKNIETTSARLLDKVIGRE